MPKSVELKNQNPVRAMQDQQLPVSEADLGAGAVQKGANYTKADRVTGASGAISMQPNPVGAMRKTLPGLMRE